MVAVGPSQPLVKEENAEPIPGYRLIKRLGRGGFGEVWECEAPGGMHKAIKFVSGDDGLALGDKSNAVQELKALQHVKSLRHPFLLSMERVEHVGTELLIVMELADKSLQDELNAARKAGQSGLPRTDLLLWMREAAEVLDLMNLEYGLQHLDIKPANLFLVYSHVKVADFGLVKSLADLNGQQSASFQLAAITPIYAPPESFHGRITLYSDQYSLAIVYHELLTGKLPFDGKNFRQLAMQHTAAEPNLTALPEGDRLIVARALAKDPGERFPSCTEFIRALIAQELPPSAAKIETAAVAPDPKQATIHDFKLIEKARTAVVQRPTKLLARSVPVNQPVLPDVPDDSCHVSLDDLQFLDCQGRSALGELWKVETPEGALRAVKLVNTLAHSGGPADAQAVRLLRALQHRGLVPSTVVAHPPNRVAVITAPLDESLGSRLADVQRAGKAGIPREEVLEHLLTTASTLDELVKLYNVQHLGLNPRNLHLVGGHNGKNSRVQIADFGLVALLWLPGGLPMMQINARYAAPELLEAHGAAGGRRPLVHCDQYSLALIYHELITGVHLFGNMTQRQLSVARSSGRITLELVPNHDRQAMLRALNADPHRRFPSCTEFVEGLVEAVEGGQAIRVSAWSSRADMAVQEAGRKLEELIDPMAMVVVPELVAAAAGKTQVRDFHGASYLLDSGKRLDHRAYARFLPGTVDLKLAGFCEQWQPDIHEAAGDKVVFRVRLQSSFWKRCLGRHPALEVDVRVTPQQSSSRQNDVHIRVSPTDCGADEGAAALERTGPQILESLRTHLQAGPERRTHVRFPFERSVQVCPIERGNTVGEAVMAHAKDISMGGMALMLPFKPASPHLMIRLMRPTREAQVPVLAKIVHTQPQSDGRFEVGVQFVVS